MSDSEEGHSSTGLSSIVSIAQRRVQFLLDKSSPHRVFRWLLFVALIGLYLLRVYLVNGWFIVTYALGIYLLHNFISFLSPRFDPDEDAESVLPVRDSDEFRPFSRKLPEFKFWVQACKAVLVAFMMTFFQVFDIPVFWPILLVYWICLFLMTMRRQISHMIRHRYIPFDIGKKSYKSGVHDSNGKK